MAVLLFELLENFYGPDSSSLRTQILRSGRTLFSISFSLFEKPLPFPREESDFASSGMPWHAITERNALEMINGTQEIVP
jgi:hypothetical protein